MPQHFLKHGEQTSPKIYGVSILHFKKENLQKCSTQRISHYVQVKSFQNTGKTRACQVKIVSDKGFSKPPSQLLRFRCEVCDVHCHGQMKQRFFGGLLGLKISW